MYLSRISKQAAIVGQFNHKFTAIFFNVSQMKTTSADIGDGPSLSSELKTFKDIPGPTGLASVPYIGAALLFKPFTRYTSSEVNDLLDDMRNKYGDIFKMRFGKGYMVYINHPDDAKTVLQANYEKHIRPPLDMTSIFAERTGTPKALILLQV